MKHGPRLSCHVISTPVVPVAASTGALSAELPPGIDPFTSAIAATGSPVTSENCRL